MNDTDWATWTQAMVAKTAHERVGGVGAVRWWFCLRRAAIGIVWWQLRHERKQSAQEEGKRVYTLLDADRCFNLVETPRTSPNPILPARWTNNL